MTPNTGILTYILQQMLNVFQAGFTNITPDAQILLGTMAMIELVLAALFWVIKGENLAAGFLRKVLVFGLFLFLVQTWPSLINTTIQGFLYTGSKAGGAAGGIPSLYDPSSVINFAFVASAPISNEIQGLSMLGDLSTILDLEFCKFAILLGCFIIAIQAFICILEFYIVAVLALILVPFGVFKHTAFLAEKAIGTVISFGVKLMVLAFILSVSVPLIQQFSLPADPTFQQCMCLSLASLAIAFLAWQAPSIAGGMLSGGPTLSAGAAVGAAAAGAGLTMAGLTASRGVAGAIGSLAGGAPGGVPQGLQNTIAAAGAGNGTSSVNAGPSPVGGTQGAGSGSNISPSQIKPMNSSSPSSMGAAASYLKSATNQAIASEGSGSGGIDFPIKHGEG